MGAPVEHTKILEAGRENPAGTLGLAFLEFSSADPAELEMLFEQFGFIKVAEHPHRAVSLWRQGEVQFLLNGDGESVGGIFAQAHGPCVSAMAFQFENAAKAYARALDCGATAYQGSRDLVVDAPAVVGIGGSLLYFVDDGTASLSEWKPCHDALRSPASTAPSLVSIDHLTHNVCAGKMEIWCDFYRKIFNFREVFYLDARATATGFRTKAMKSPCGKICIPINEPSDPKSQIQEYIDVYRGEGVQHIAFTSNNIYSSVEELARRGVEFVNIPAPYFEGVDVRMPNHGEDVPRLARNGILIDGELDSARSSWAVLLQIFTKPIMGPIFFELIQRKGNDGFGDNNAKLLFEALELDQIARGVVSGIPAT